MSYPNLCKIFTLRLSIKLYDFGTVQITVESEASMPKRCGDPECGNLVNERKVHHRLGDNLFCSIDCANAWLVQNKVFEVASDPFHVPIERRAPKQLNGG